ncbi:hypothetical protein KGM_213802 [Danaus plexippus plexippus]|uniref:Uncharacterized protein n=1 Tax=Danaus plexippus plexippus TaxID=278856 RepID=A0A212FPW3_DANPL|nr:hypothetical protein KGM_213802 [Danaus plexippus plexippus]
MSGTDVTSRNAESVSMPTDLPVRLYMRALRQYQKLIDLKRFTKEKAIDNRRSRLLNVAHRSTLDTVHQS